MVPNRVSLDRKDTLDASICSIFLSSMASVSILPDRKNTLDASVCSASSSMVPSSLVSTAMFCVENDVREKCSEGGGCSCEVFVVESEKLICADHMHH